MKLYFRKKGIKVLILTSEKQSIPECITDTASVEQ